MFKKSILFLGTFFVLSNSFAMGPFPSLEELKLQFEKLRPTLDMQMQATANALANTEPTTFSKMMSEQFEQLKQDSVQCVEPAIENTTSEIDLCINSARLEQHLMLCREIMRIYLEEGQSRDRYKEVKHDEIKQDSGEKTEPLTEEKVDVMEMLIELMEKERRDAFQRSLEDRDFMRLLP
ncbi:MAG: hypothetical protein Q8L85_03935 [Alphaproteobacteria bacterium]|nr:hypothetical protein [Alphaproteobacteria bacterium]